MTHREIKELVPLLAIGRLEGKEREEVLRHLEVCEECRRLYEDERRLLALMEGVVDVVPPPPPTSRGRFPYVRRIAFAVPLIILFLGLLLFLRHVPAGREEASGHPTVEVSGLEDIWSGYVLVQGEGYLKVEVSIDGEVVAVGRGKDYVYLEPTVSKGEHYVAVRVISGKDTLSVDRVVLYDPETYALATGEE